MKELQLQHIKDRKDKIMSNIAVTPSGCWEWRAGRHNQGYGMMQIHGKKYYVHRLMAMLKYGRIIDGKEFVCHTCDNPPCCNPKHLFIGDQAANIHDASEKGRMGKGENHHKARLTPELVTEVREKYATGKYHMEDLAKYAGVAFATIRKAITGETWGHVPGAITGDHTVRGNRSHKSKLNRVLVIKMREMYSTGNYTYKELADLSGVTTGAAGDAITGKSWGHVPGAIVKD